MIRSALCVSLVLLGLALPSTARAEPIHKVELNLSVTWAGKRGIQIPITPGSTEPIKGLCPPIIEINSKFDPSAPIQVDARYTLSDGRNIDRKQETFMGGLYTEDWELPIHDPGQQFKGSVKLHINSPGIDKNDVMASFTVACATQAEATAAAAAAACDASGNSCHQGTQLASPIRTMISAEAPPKEWTGGTIAPGTYLLTGVKQYTYKDMKVTDDGKASQVTIVVKKNGTGETAEMVATEGTCTQRSIITVTHDPKVTEGIAAEYAGVFAGAHAMMLGQSCPASAAGMGFPAAYSVTAEGFKAMFFTGTMMTFTRK